MIDFLYYMGIGAIRVVLFFIVLCLVIAAMAWGAEYIGMPLARRIPPWVGKAWRFVWRSFLVGVGVMFAIMFLYVAGGGPQL